ncbi:hypothetical protein UQW22_09170 [Isoptericola halotolerans]|uniref:hypothetical protein n=1 Tax=Isoptericola halotolerans TaxID=300560 RepID=UPI00388DF1C6
MSIVLTVLVGLPVAAATLVLWLAGRRTHDGAALRRARRHDSLITLVATLAAAATAVLALSLPLAPDRQPSPAAPGVVQAVAPFAVAVVHCLVRLAGELTWPRPSGTVRHASLARRTVRRTGGTSLTHLAVTATVLTAALLVTGVTAAPDGRSVAGPPVILPDGGLLTGSSGPYPGWPYAVPMLAGLAVALLATLATLRVVAHRAPLASLDRYQDDALRRTSAARVLAVTHVCVGATTTLTLLVVALAVRNAGIHQTSAATTSDPGMLVAAAVSGALAVAVAAGTVVAVVVAGRAHVAVGPDPR